jgi:hypothetical protein
MKGCFLKRIKHEWLVMLRGGETSASKTKRFFDKLPMTSKLDL